MSIQHNPVQIGDPSQSIKGLLAVEFEVLAELIQVSVKEAQIFIKKDCDKTIDREIAIVEDFFIDFLERTIEKTRSLE